MQPKTKLSDYVVMTLLRSTLTTNHIYVTAAALYNTGYPKDDPPALCAILCPSFYFQEP